MSADSWRQLYENAQAKFEAMEGVHIWDRFLRIGRPNMVFFIERLQEDSSSQPKWLAIDQFRHGGFFMQQFKTKRSARAALVEAGLTEAPSDFFRAAQNRG
jgi:hypothetical protein